MHCDIFCATLPTCSMHDVVTSSSSPLNDVPGFLQHLRPVACNTFLIRCNIFLLVSKLHDLPDTLSPRLTVTCQMLLIRWSNFFKWVQTCSWYIATYSWYVETSSAKWHAIHMIESKCPAHHLCRTCCSHIERLLCHFLLVLPSYFTNVGVSE